MFLSAENSLKIASPSARKNSNARQSGHAFRSHRGRLSAHCGNGITAFQPYAKDRRSNLRPASCHAHPACIGRPHVTPSTVRRGVSDRAEDPERTRVRTFFADCGTSINYPLKLQAYRTIPNGHKSARFLPAVGFPPVNPSGGPGYHFFPVLRLRPVKDVCTYF